MYSQVYLHHIRRIYDIHLKDFLKGYFKKETGNPYIPTEPTEFLKYKNSLIYSEIYSSSDTKAKRISRREHFKLIYERNAQDINLNPDAVEVLTDALKEEFGEENVRKDVYEEEGGISDFPVIDRNNNIVNAFSESEVLEKIPRTIVGYIFVNPQIKSRVKQWLEENKENILRKEVRYE